MKVPLTRRQARELIRPSSAVGSSPEVPRTAQNKAAEEPAASGFDAFEAAVRLSTSHNETTKPAQPVSASGPTSSTATPRRAFGPSKARKPRPRHAGFSFKRVTAVTFSSSVLGLVALLTVGMTLPAEALPHEHAPDSVAGDVFDRASEDIQAFIAPPDVQNAEISRDGGYSVASLVTLAGTVGISNFSSSVFTNDRACAVQWPYAVGVPTSSGFGMRNGRMHEGTDFVPGAGAEIQSIADGVVRTSTDSGGAFGVTIVIDHLVDGQRVSSRYAHMEYDSRQVEVGDTVSVGEYIGRTGDTGRSFGAHLHFEVLLDGTTATDPLPWLKSYASC